MDEFRTACPDCGASFDAGIEEGIVCPRCHRGIIESRRWKVRKIGYRGHVGRLLTISEAESLKRQVERGGDQAEIVTDVATTEGEL